MVVKQRQHFDSVTHTFESSVISYGSKTCGLQECVKCKFESSVISYGSKTNNCPT